MPLTRARKKKAEAEEEEPAAPEQPKPEETGEQLRGSGSSRINLRDPIMTDVDELERAFEESEKEVSDHDEDEDMKRALELSMESLEEEDADYHRALEQSKTESKNNLETPTASSSGASGSRS